MTSSIRSQRANAKQAAMPGKQIEHLTFTLSGYALEEGMKQRGLYECICAYEKSAKSFKKIIGDYETKAVAEGHESEEEQPTFRKSAVYSARELGEPEAGVRQYLVVGYALRSIPSVDIRRVKNTQQKQQPVGINEPSPDDIFKWDSKNPPAIVVTEITKAQPDGIQLYGLLHPKNGLSTPYTIAQNLVFYRHEFRDDTTAIAKRGPAWNCKVAQHSVRPGVDAAPLTKKQQVFKRAKDSTKLCFNPNISLANEIACLAASYAHTPDGWFLDEIKTVLKTVDDDLNYRPLPENGALRNFVETEEYITLEQAREVAVEFRASWPSVEFVTELSIKTLQNELVRSKAQLEYRLLKPFLAEGCWHLRNQDYEGEELAAMTLDVMNTVRRIIGDESAAPISASDQNAILMLLITKLEEIKKNGNQMEEAMKNVFGDTAFSHTVYDIWAEFADASDTDTARAAFMQALKVVAAGSRQQEKGLSGMIEDILISLQKLKLHAQQ